MYDGWFEDDELNSHQRAVVNVVRESARSWPECPPHDTGVLVFGPGEDDEEDVPPERIGRIAAAWFEEIMNRPIVSSHPVVGGGYRFAPPCTALPPGHRWVRNGTPAINLP
ncbi:MAG: hypothetical protein QOF98_3539 [Streptomyces sp.]|nr:hypothetical protein [Streptomyces sp.]